MAVCFSLQWALASICKMLTLKARHEFDPLALIGVTIFSPLCAPSMYRLHLLWGFSVYAGVAATGITHNDVTNTTR